MNDAMLRYSTTGKIVTISFSRSGKFNTINAPIPKEMQHAVQTANQDPDLQVYRQGPDHLKPQKPSGTRPA